MFVRRVEMSNNKILSSNCNGSLWELYRLEIAKCMWRPILELAEHNFIIDNSKNISHDSKHVINNVPLPDYRYGVSIHDGRTGYPRCLNI